LNVTISPADGGGSVGNSSASRGFATALPAEGAGIVGANQGTVSQNVITGGQVAPRISLQAQGGSDRGIATADLFVPVWQDAGSVAFFDLRGIATTEEEFEGNLGLGYRTVVGDLFGEEAVAGAYAFFDVRQSQNDNTYIQGAVGLELLTDTFEGRINGYLPNSDRNVVRPGGPAGIGLVGTTVTQLNTLGIVEQALPGAEIELGVNLDLSDDIRANLTGGYFHFERDDTRVSGPKGRLELSYSDPFGFDGAILTFGGEIRHDDIRETDANGFVRLSIPLGANPTPQRDLSPRARKLGRYVYRDVDILVPPVVDNSTVGGGGAPLEGSPEADGSGTGAPGSPNAPGAPNVAGETLNVYHVANTAQGAGDCTSAANACTQATAFADPLFGAGDFIIPVDAAGNIVADFDLTGDAQSIVGAVANTGSVTLVLPDEANSLLTLSGLGGRATITGTVSPQNGSLLANFDLDGAAGPAILFDDNNGTGTVRVQDVAITGGAYGLQATPGGSRPRTSSMADSM
jgi:hypothetical protein